MAINKQQTTDFKDLFHLGKETMSKWGHDKSYSNSPVDVVDFFCCAGGMSLGFASLKNIYSVRGGVDINPISLLAYHNNYHVPTIEADIASMYGDIDKVKKNFNISSDNNRPLVLIGCAPCQGFSAHRKVKRERPEDTRNTLIGAFADIAVELNPDFVVMENVPEILTGKYRSHYDEAKTVFQSNGYHVVQRVYNAAGFGVPWAQ